MRIFLLVTTLAVAALAGTASAATQLPTASKCYTLISGGDMGETYCIDDGECLVAEYRTTFLGTERYCTVRKP